MNHDHDASAWFKVAVAWAGAAVGSITLSQFVLFLTAIFTVLQIWKLIREWRRERRLEKFEAWLKREPNDPA